MTDDKPGGAAADPQTLQCIYTERAPQPFGDAYCQAIVAGGFVFVSGQGGFLPDGTLVGDGAEEQAAQMIKNIQAILEQAGAGLKDVVRTTIYYTDMSDALVVNAVYKAAFDGEVKPARMVFQVAAPPVPDSLVSMDAQAVLPHG